MKNLKKLIFPLIIILLIIGCGEGKKGELKIVKNPMNPKVPELKLDLIKSIDFGNEITEISSWLVADEKVYFVSLSEKSVSIFDFDGNPLKKLDSVGKGPGEFLMPQAILNDFENNRIQVFDNMARRNSYFTYNGEYIEDVQLQDFTFPESREKMGNNFVEFTVKMTPTDNNIVLSPTIKIIKTDSTIVVESKNVELNPKKMDPSELALLYACSNKKVFVSNLSNEKYEINVYDAAGNKIEEIEKKYKKTLKPQKDIDEFNERMKKYEEANAEAGANTEFYLEKFKYQQAIDNLVYDHNGHLWVKTHNSPTDNHYDIIDSETGKIIKKWIVEKNSGFLKFYKNKVIEIVQDNENDKTIMNIYKMK